ncbi:MAG TPA: NAD(P)H-dependent oxidoreductase [Burkholderiaceae bacterium]|jgi:FMN-dependent NADH-azoreductase
MKILHIDSSILGAHSASRRLSAAAVARLREAHPGAEVIHRDVADREVPHFSGALAGVAGVPAEQRSPELQRQASELAAVLDEVLAADVIVVGAPMYNFGIPSQLKAWLDALAVPGKTFQYTAAGPKGLLGDKRVIIASARGGFYGPETALGALDHQETHLRSFLGFLGVTRLEVVRAEGLKVSDEMHARGMEAGLQQAAALEAA